MIKEKIERYKTFDEQEARDKEYFLNFMSSFQDVLTRENVFGHFTSSAFVLNETGNKMLVVYHNINDGWIYPWGHADGESDLLSVAVREVLEETGVRPIVRNQNIFGIQVLPVRGHVKHGKYVSAHVHLDVVYLMQASEEEALKFRPDESRSVKWVELDKAYDESFCDFIRPVHQKLIRKLG